MLNSLQVVDFMDNTISPSLSCPEGSQENDGPG